MHGTLTERAKKVRGSLVALMAFVLVLGALEAFQRVKDYIKWRKLTRTPYAIKFETWSGVPVTEKGGSLILTHHPHLIYTFRSSQQRPEARINSQGFRGKEWTGGAVKHCRAIVLGGSATFGQGASADDKVFVQVLERLLSSNARRPVEVLNAGVIGYDSTQELLLITTVLLDYHPDLFIILDGWNDFYASGIQPPGQTQAINGTFMNFDEVIARNSQRWMNLFRISAFFRWAEEKVRLAWHKRTTHSRKFHHYSDNLAAFLPKYKSNITRMVRIARSHGAEMIMSTQPELFQRQGRIPKSEEELRAKYSQGRYEGYADLSRQHYPAFVNAAKEVAAIESAEFVNSAAAFDEFDGTAFVDFVHFGDEGHERLAHYLLPTVSRVLNQRASNPACHLR